MVRNEKPQFAFHQVGTYNVYKHKGTETAQCQLEIILNMQNPLPKFNDFSWLNIRMIIMSVVSLLNLNAHA